MNFQQIILTLAIIVLIIMLVFIGLALSKSKYSGQWPPIVGDCPDYWVDLEGNGAACYNAHALGRCNIPSDHSPNTMDFSTQPFNGENGLCSKYRWANSCNVTWDGITSGVKNPCQSDTTDTTS